MDLMELLKHHQIALIEAARDGNAIADDCRIAHFEERISAKRAQLGVDDY